MIAQKPWFERTFDFNFDLSLFPVIFSRLEGSFFRLQGILVNADDEATGKAITGWSVKQHLGHLTDLEELWFRRLEDFRNGAPELTVADLTNRRTEEAGHNEKPLERLLMEFVQARQKTLETIYPFDETELALRSVHPRLQQPMRLIDSLFFVAEHDDHHIASISQLLRVPVG